MPAGERKDPFKNYMFLVEIEGIAEAGFREASIPDSTQNVIEYREGNQLPTNQKLPGLVKYGNVTLKEGVTDSLNLYNWRKAVEDGQIGISRKNMAIVILNDEGLPAARWEFSQAWPSKYKAPDLNAAGNEIAIEILEIVHEGMKRTQ